MTRQAKLERAKRHYAELEAALKSFFSTNPYKISTRRNDAGKLVYYLSDVADVPVELSLITGDVIQNLRSALDHLAYDLWVKEASGRGRDDKIYFPIDKDEASYNTRSARTRAAMMTCGASTHSITVISTVCW
jgi:hypothetical protein